MKKLFILGLLAGSVAQLAAMDPNKMELKSFKPVYIDGSEKERIKPSEDMLKLMELAQQHNKTFLTRIPIIKYKVIMSLLKNVNSEQINYQDEKGNTLLHLFLNKWLGKLVTWNMDNDMIKNQTKVFGQIMGTIIGKGFNLNLQNNNGDTVSHIAAEKKDRVILHELQLYGANFDIMNNRKKSVYNLIYTEAGARILINNLYRKIDALQKTIKKLSDQVQTLQKNTKEQDEITRLYS